MRRLRFILQTLFFFFFFFFFFVPVFCNNVVNLGFLIHPLTLCALSSLN